MKPLGYLTFESIQTSNRIALKIQRYDDQELVRGVPNVHAMFIAQLRDALRGFSRDGRVICTQSHLKEFINLATFPHPAQTPWSDNGGNDQDQQ
eukprot:602473-Amphidinium_carterae.1